MSDARRGGVTIGTPEFSFHSIGRHGMFFGAAPVRYGARRKARPAMRPVANSFLVSRLARVRG
jgi:hypothetical protein